MQNPNIETTEETFERFLAATAAKGVKVKTLSTCSSSSSGVGFEEAEGFLIITAPLLRLLWIRFWVHEEKGIPKGLHRKIFGDILCFAVLL